MALKVLITAIDTTNTAKSFGIVGSVLLNESDIKRAAKPIAANDDAVSYQKTELNSKKLVAVIDQLSIMDNLFKQKLTNQKIAYQNNKLNEQEDRIERQSRLEKLKDAEKVHGSEEGGLGFLALAGIGLLAYDPIMNAIKGVVDFTVEAGTFISDTVKEITSFFNGFLPDEPEEESIETTALPTALPAGTLRGQAEAGVTNPPPPPPAPVDAKPIPPPAKPAGSLRGQAEAGDYKKPVVTAGPTQESKPATSSKQVKDDRSWWERNAPSWAGGKSAPSAQSGQQESAAKSPSSKVIKVSHPSTGEGWGIAGANDQRGRPVVFTKEGAEAFYKMMIDSNGVVKPSDVTSSKRTRAYQEEMKKQGYNPATRSLHLSGLAMDIHGESNAWIKKHGAKYGWVENKYKGTHGGHFQFGGKGLSPEQGEVTARQSVAERVVNKGGEVVDKTLTNMAEFIGTIGGKVVGPGVARDLTTAAPDFAKLISNEAAVQTAEIAKIKSDANKPAPRLTVSPPNISAAGSTAVQNAPTMIDRNSVQYYLSRFGYKETNAPIKVAR
jgi:hypothetical protein